MNDQQLFYIGTYTEPILFGTGQILQGKGAGIYRLKLDRRNRTMAVIGLTPDVRNPSFLAMTAEHDYLYAVNELKTYEGTDGGSISAFRVINEQGELAFCGSAPTHGKDPCHVAVSSDGSCLIVSNFSTGSVTSYLLGKDGMIQEADFVQHEGASLDLVRQQGPHAHSCIKVKGTDKVLIPDLGMDKLMVYEIDTEGKLILREDEIYTCPPGSGPRYGEFHPVKPVLYLIHELSSSVGVLAYDSHSGQLACLQEISTLPEPCENICADLHVSGDGRFVYASNRGHDSIAVFAVDAEDGTLRLIAHVPCGGKTPRNFALDPSGDFLLAGNQDSDCIVLFERDAETGLLAEASRIEVPTPVCICLA